jgi:tRNA dimethylallyltransferase
VVLNADSRQIYTGMDIGTSKVRPDDQGGFEHRLLDIADPAGKMPLEGYVARARTELAKLADDPAALPIFVGGTGVYVQALQRAWNLDGTADLRRTLQRDLPRSDPEAAHDVLRRLAPDRARKVHPRNYEAVVNALVRTMAEPHDPKPQEPFELVVFGLDRGAAQTDARIQTTFADQLDRGLLDEIATLDDRLGLVDQARRLGPDAPSVVLQTHGYRELIDRAAATGRPIRKLGDDDLARVGDDVIAHITAYSRRQRSWFRKLGAVRVEPRTALAKVLRTSGLG